MSVLYGHHTHSVGRHHFSERMEIVKTTWVVLMVLSLMAVGAGVTMLIVNTTPWKIHDPWNHPEYVLENGNLKYVGPGQP